ncbi:MAG: MFS transporter [Gammaproteobacteria bacterium]
MSSDPGIIAPLADDAPARPWYRQVTTAQWRAFRAVFLSWIVASFDFNILAFVLIDIQRSFTVDRALAGALGTVTLLMRLVGGTVAGTLADRWGRKLPLMLALAWLSLFACLSGLASSYTWLFALRALFGLGMGGVWAAGMPLVFEHWPTRLRGLVSGMMLGGWYWGYLLAAAVFELVYPRFDTQAEWSWRVLLLCAALPAIFVPWIRRHVDESPVWLTRQRQLHEARAAGQPREPALSLSRIFQPDLIVTTLQTTLVIGSFMCLYYAVNFWYPTFLRDAGHQVLPYLAVFNVGAIAGTTLWGWLSEGRLGRRGAATVTVLLGIASLPLYLHAKDPLLLGVGALCMGFFGMGIWGMAPAYTSERFPTEVRGVGPGFCYHAAAAFGALMPYLLGALQDRGFVLVDAMSIAMIASGLAAMVIWLGPETRGREFTP